MCREKSSPAQDGWKTSPAVTMTCQPLKMKTKRKCYRKSELPMSEGIVPQRFFFFFCYIYHSFALSLPIYTYYIKHVYRYIFLSVKWWVPQRVHIEIFEYVILEAFVLKRILIVSR